MQVLCLYEPNGKSTPRLKSVLRKQQYTVTRFDCHHLAHVIGLWQMPNFLCPCSVFALFHWIWGQFPSTSHPEACILKGDLSEGLRYEYGGGGLHSGGAYFRNFTVYHATGGFSNKYKSWRRIKFYLGNMHTFKKVVTLLKIIHCLLAPKKWGFNSCVFQCREKFS